MAGERAGLLRAVSAHARADAEAGAVLLGDLPPAWRGPVIGPAIAQWPALTGRRRPTPIDLSALAERLGAELAWMARWQVSDGVKIDVSSFNQIASALAWAKAKGRPVPDTLTAIDLGEFAAVYTAWTLARTGRLRTDAFDRRRRAVLGYPRLALQARLHPGPWWRLDAWLPRCDPRIPLREREPLGASGSWPGSIETPWLRGAVKWCLGTQLETGSLAWSTVLRRVQSLRRLDRWLLTTSDPQAITHGDAGQATALALDFRRWTSDPANRGGTGATVSLKVINEDLLAVSDLLAFIAQQRSSARAVLGPTPWGELTDAHAVLWRLQQLPGRIRAALINETQYVDDYALGQIAAYLPALAADRGDSVEAALAAGAVTVPGQGDPQAMRMLLLQILTGRRASEICLCDADCLSPATPGAVAAVGGQEVARFRYGQSKIDQAPDTILVDAEVVAVIEEQRAWVAEHFPGHRPRYLFLQRKGNNNAAKAYSQGAYGSALRAFAGHLEITDGAGRPVSLTHTHRFRHTRLTRLAELGLPVHVLQRYAGHATPTMSMHYVARREEHAEQAFLATAKFKADGTRVAFSRDDHDGMHLFDRADRFLPNGYCTLPPLQSCDKGNACLTCSVFVTDASYLPVLAQQQAETEELIKRRTQEFQARFGKPMPADNIWLAERNAERDALTRLVKTIQAADGRACQGAGNPTGPTPVTLDLTHHRRSMP